MKIVGRLRTVSELLAHFVARGRWFFVPLVLLLLLGGVLLLLTGGLSYVAPFLYALF